MRLTPPDVDVGEEFKSGAALFFGATTNKDTYFLTLDDESVKMLASDLVDYLKLDVRGGSKTTPSPSSPGPARKTP